MPLRAKMTRSRRAVPRGNPRVGLEECSMDGAGVRSSSRVICITSPHLPSFWSGLRAQAFQGTHINICMLGEGGKATSPPVDRLTVVLAVVLPSAVASLLLVVLAFISLPVFSMRKKPSDYYMDGMHFLRVATKLFRYVPKDMFLRYQRRKKRYICFPILFLLQ
jgi:hypothetical protein